MVGGGAAWGSAIAQVQSLASPERAGNVPSETLENLNQGDHRSIQVRTVCSVRQLLTFLGENGISAHANFETGKLLSFNSKNRIQSQRLLDIPLPSLSSHSEYSMP